MDCILANKSDTFIDFSKFAKIVQNGHFKITSIRSDRRGEIENHLLGTFVLKIH